MGGEMPSMRLPGGFDVAKPFDGRSPLYRAESDRARQGKGRSRNNIRNCPTPINPFFSEGGVDEFGTGKGFVIVRGLSQDEADRQFTLHQCPPTFVKGG